MSKKSAKEIRRWQVINTRLATTCERCGRRNKLAAKDNWNIEFAVGLIVGAICPDCQTDEEDLEAMVNEVMDDLGEAKVVHHPETDDERERYIYRLLETCPTPEIKRAKADRLEAARPDAGGLVSLLRTMADDQESGNW